MAALDRRISILDEFVGQSWNSWIDKADVSAPEGAPGEEGSKNVKKRMETMTLLKEDMCIYGNCPAHDDFYLVVCSHCGQVVKPQAFEKHCERRHGSLGKLCGSQSSLSSPLSHRPQPGRPPSQQRGPREGQEGKQQGAEPPRVPPLHSPLHKAPKAQKDGTSFLQLGKISDRSPPSPPYLSTPVPQDPLWNRGSTPPKMPPPLEKPPQKGTEVPRPPHGARTYSKIYKKVPKKECDLDKHCGVLDLEKKKLCTRLLTCNIHSIHQRRQVVGRSKSFDQLVLELKMSSKTRERPVQTRDAPEAPSPTAGDPVAQLCRRQPASVSLRSRTPPGSGTESEECVRPSEEADVLSAQRPPLHSASLSSEESDGDNQEESADLPTSTCHPKPLGLCTFGARVLGCSVLAFDRRLFRLRSALSAMVEHHLNAHLWKKIPQVSELRTHHPPASQSAYISHDAMRIPPSKVPTPSASSLRTSASSVSRRPSGDTSTSGQSEPRASSLTPPSKTLTKAPVITASGPGRPRNKTARPNKQTLQTKLGQLQESSTSRKRRRPPPEDEASLEQSKSFPYVQPKDNPQQPPSTRPSLSPSHRPPNGALSSGSKSRSHSHLSETQGSAKRRSAPSSARTPPHFLPESSGDGGASGRVSSHEHKGPGKKRKTSGASSSEPHSGHAKPSSLFWRRDSQAGPASFSVEKKLDAPKPKLHH